MLTIEIKTIGENQFWEMRVQLDKLVKEHFDLLYEGAVRLRLNIGDDYYAPRRVQIGETRLHARQGLKYASGHKYDFDEAPTEEQLRQTVSDLQKLIDAAAENIAAPFSIKITIPKNKTTP